MRLRKKLTNSASGTAIEPRKFKFIVVPAKRSASRDPYLQACGFANAGAAIWYNNDLRLWVLSQGRRY